MVLHCPQLLLRMTQEVGWVRRVSPICKLSPRSPLTVAIGAMGWQLWEIPTAQWSRTLPPLHSFDHLRGWFWRIPTNYTFVENMCGQNLSLLAIHQSRKVLEVFGDNKWEIKAGVAAPWWGLVARTRPLIGAKREQLVTATAPLFQMRLLGQQQRPQRLTTKKGARWPWPVGA